MLGRNHALSGLVMGAWTLPLAHLASPAEQAAYVITWGGFALLPDLDSAGSSAARMWGWPTRLAGRLIGKLAGGHRQGTHDALLAPLAVGLLAWVGSLSALGTGLVVAVTTGLALAALDAVTSRVRFCALLNLGISAAAGWLAAGSDERLWWLPFVACCGVLMHLLGDWPTTTGLPVPLQWCRGGKARFGPSLFATGSVVEGAIGWGLIVLTAWALIRGVVFI